MSVDVPQTTAEERAGWARGCASWLQGEQAPLSNRFHCSWVVDLVADYDALAAQNRALVEALDEIAQSYSWDCVGHIARAALSSQPVDTELERLAREVLDAEDAMGDTSLDNAQRGVQRIVLAKQALRAALASEAGERRG